LHLPHIYLTKRGDKEEGHQPWHPHFCIAYLLLQKSAKAKTTLNESEPVFLPMLKPGKGGQMPYIHLNTPQASQCVVFKLSLLLPPKPAVITVFSGSVGINLHPPVHQTSFFPLTMCK
jgi:hypothetical protein